MVPVLRMPEPVIGDAKAARKSHLPVDDKNFPVRSVVDFFELIPMGRIKFGDLTSLAQPGRVGR